MNRPLEMAAAPRDRIECVAAATGAPLGSVPVDDPASVRAAVSRARRAQHDFAHADFARRRRLLGRLSDRIVEEIDTICGWVVEDSGKTREHALMGEVWPVLEKLRWTMRHGERHLAPERVSPGIFAHKTAYLRYEPLGVVGAIVPWNYPFQNLLGPIVTALFAGNAIVLKPSEHVAFSSEKIAGLVREVLREAGEDPDLVQIVQGYAETGQALIAAGIDGLLFIGSVQNGKKVLAAAAEQVIPVVLELGGKDPFIVCDDADLEQAVHGAFAGCFISAGQNCVAAERLLVHKDVYDRFVARVAELASKLRQGPPGLERVVDVGAMTTPMQREIVERLVADAIAKGAQVVAGGEPVRSAGGNFVAPTVLADVRPHMDIFREEVFGPVMCITKVVDDEDAVELANATAYGLGASVFSRDLERARRIVRRLEAGMCAINDFGGLTYMAQDLTFGGVKASGFGRMNGRDGLRAMCRQKSVLDERVPLGIANKLFPVGPKDYQRIAAAVRMIYGRGLGARLRGAARLVRGLGSSSS